MDGRHNLRNTLGLAFLLTINGTLARGEAHSGNSRTTNRAQLDQRVMAHLTQPRFGRAVWGLKVVSLDTGATLLEHNASKLFKPASNAKLFTAALALDCLGTDHRIKTSFHAATKPDRSGRLKGDLIVFGRGDPGFTARGQGGDHERVLQPLVDALNAVGVRSVSGDLVGDERFFRGPPFGSGWEWDDLQHGFGAEVSALTQEDNCIEVVLTPAARLGEPCRIATEPVTRYLFWVNRTTTTEAESQPRIELYRAPGQNTVMLTGHLPLGGLDHHEAVAVHDPARWFVSRLKEQLARNGIRIAGRVRTVGWFDPAEASPARPVGGERQGRGPDAASVEIGSVESRPMADLVAEMLKESSNLEAQLLLWQVGAAVEDRLTSPDAKTTEETAIEELGHLLTRIQVPDTEVLLDEGSGLSRNALLTPNAVVALLRAMAVHRYAEIWRRSLPIAGVDGTLSRRMKVTAAEGNVRAKTGSLRRTRALSGYVKSAAGESLAFSLMLNNYEPESGQAADRDIDAIAIMLAEFQGRTGAEP
jgi:serine-type D-Ala-D-Ala carboxypeptidase/endopeptidase (penicillin-binding protein 4)